MNELVLSSSSVEAYVSCHYRWYLSYVEASIGQQNVPAAIGLAVHAAIEHHYKARVSGQPVPTLESLDVYATRFMLETIDMGEPMHENTALPKWRQIGRRAAAAYLEDVAPAIKPVFVERGGRIKINGIEYSYHIDLTDEARVVHDTKIKKSKPRDAGRYLPQMTGYALAFRVETGSIETDNVIDIMIRLKRDRPYLVVMRYGGPISEHDIGVFARRLQNVAEGIDRDDYRPTGLETGECRYCPVSAGCVYYAEFLKTTGEASAAPAPLDD